MEIFQLLAPRAETNKWGLEKRNVRAEAASESPYKKEKANQTTHQLHIPLSKVHLQMPNFQRTFEAW